MALEHSFLLNATKFHILILNTISFHSINFYKPVIIFLGKVNFSCFGPVGYLAWWFLNPRERKDLLALSSCPWFLLSFVCWRTDHTYTTNILLNVLGRTWQPDMRSRLLNLSWKFEKKIYSAGEEDIFCWCWTKVPLHVSDIWFDWQWRCHQLWPC